MSTSPTPTSALNMALTPTFRHAYDSFERLRIILANGPLVGLFTRTVGTFILDYQVNLDDVLVRLDYGESSYSLQPHVAAAMGFGITNIVRIISCAAHNINPRTARLPMRLQIPSSSLLQLNLPFPAILLALTCDPVVYLTRPFVRQCDLLSMINVMQHIANYYVGWIAEAIKQSIILGPASDWNWGAFWGITWPDFLNHIYTTFPPSHLEIWHNTTGLIEPYDRDDIESSLAVIINPTAAYLVDTLLGRSEDLSHGEETNPATALLVDVLLAKPEDLPPNEEDDEIATIALALATTRLSDAD